MEKHLFFLPLLLIVACSSQRQVTKSHTEQNTELQKIYIDKNVFQDKWHILKIKGDTVWRTDSIVITTQNTIYDTIFIKIQSTDTIPEIIIKEKQLNKIQQSALKSGYLFWLLILLLVGTKIIKIIAKFYGI